MLTTQIDKNTQRQIIAKLRRITEVKPSFTLEHVRTRKTAKTGEMNSYILWTPSGDAAVQVFNATRVDYRADLASVL